MVKKKIETRQEELLCCRKRDNTVLLAFLCSILQVLFRGWITQFVVNKKAHLAGLAENKTNVNCFDGFGSGWNLAGIFVGNEEKLRAP